jgi:hypothetical protein
MNNHRGFEGELLPPEAIRKGTYDLGRVNRVPPEVGIFDSPTLLCGKCRMVESHRWYGAFVGRCC